MYWHIYPREAGYGDTMIERVKKAVGKRGIKVNPESHLLEDLAKKKRAGLDM